MSALGWVALIVLISGSSTGLTCPLRCAPSRDRRRRIAAELVAAEPRAGACLLGRSGAAADPPWSAAGEPFADGSVAAGPGALSSRAAGRLAAPFRSAGAWG